MRSYPRAAEGLAFLLEKNGLTLKEAAARAKIPYTTLQGVLAGRLTSISTRNMLALAQLFQTPMANLIDFFS